MKENLAIKPHEPRKLRFTMSHPEETANKTTHVTFDQWNIFGKHVICHHWLSPPCWERFIGWNMDENGVFQNQTSTNRPKKTSSKQITTVKHCETWKSSLNLSISTYVPPFCHHFSQCFFQSSTPAPWAKNVMAIQPEVELVVGLILTNPTPWPRSTKITWYLLETGHRHIYIYMKVLK